MSRWNTNRFGRGSTIGRDRDRSRSPLSRPSSMRRTPPGKTEKVDPKKIKIILPVKDGIARQSGAESIWHHGVERKFGSVEQALVRCLEGSKGFQGAELEEPKSKSLRKIQIEIRRNIPRGLVSNSPVTRSLKNSVGGLLIPRRPEEGMQPIFERDEIRQLVEESTKRIISLGRSPSKSPPRRGFSNLYSDNGKKGRVKDRLGSESLSRSCPKDVRSRLGTRKEKGDENRVLGREDLEKLRLTKAVSPWEVNPEFVPKGRGYFEHDNREDFFDERTRGPFDRRGFGSNRFRNNRWRAGRRDSNKRGRSGSPDWKHDKFEDINDAENKA